MKLSAKLCGSEASFSGTADCDAAAEMCSSTVNEKAYVQYAAELLPTPCGC